MIARLVRPLRFLALAVTDEATPRRVALAVALGATIGLIPKDNLIVLALVLLLFALRLNIFAGVLAAIIFSCAGLMMTPFLDHMGHSLLTVIPFLGFYEWLLASPLGAWTRFNNTIVAGGFLVGILISVPLYLTTKAFCAKRLDRWANNVLQTETGRVLLGEDVTARWRIGS